jgi:hypothetical protein
VHATAHHQGQLSHTMKLRIYILNKIERDISWTNVTKIYYLLVTRVNNGVIQWGRMIDNISISYLFCR